MNNLKKITNLIKKTGDKIIVVDDQMEPQFVIMKPTDYEKLLTVAVGVSDLTEDELLSKINRDIAFWKSGQDLEKDFNQQDKDWSNVDKLDSKSFGQEKKEKLAKKIDDEYRNKKHGVVDDEDIIKREIEKIDDLKRKAVELQEIQKETRNKSDDEAYFFEPTDEEDIDF